MKIIMFFFYCFMCIMWCGVFSLGCAGIGYAIGYNFIDCFIKIFIIVFCIIFTIIAILVLKFIIDRVSHWYNRKTYKFPFGD